MTDRDAKIERAIGDLLAAFPLVFSTEQIGRAHV
jgi:hypothetical protein